MLKLYSSLADWWPLLSDPAEYAEEARLYARMLREHARRPIRTLLELGCGGGNNASHMKRLMNADRSVADECRMTLTDLSPHMLAVSRRLNPQCVHVAGDMRMLRLLDERGASRTFDAVFVHDAVMYLVSAEDLRQAMQTAFVHCAPGGVALFTPDCTRETWKPETDHGGHDSLDGSGRSLRYVEWKHDTDPNDSEYSVDMVYMLRERERMTVEHERHRFGLFDTATWLRLLSEVGFRPSILPDLPGECETGTCFVGIRD